MFFDGRWAATYTSHVVRPLQNLFANQTFNNVLVIALWGFVGLCVYFLIEYSVNLYKAWRHEQTDIQYLGPTTIRHPMRRTFVATVVWRVGVIILAVLFFAAIQPVITRLLADPRLLTDNFAVASVVGDLVVTFAGWAVLAHCGVVLLRLFLMRTRLFAEALY
jgi:heme/copper-type cytochrome/quinol oxidase subunit 2